MKQLFLMLVLALGLVSCGPKNDQNQQQNGYGQQYGNPNINDYCLQVRGADPRCQGYAGMGNPYFQNYPTQGGYYNYNSGCQQGWAPVYGSQYGLGCFNQQAYPGNYYQYNWMGNQYGNYGVTAAIQCNPGAYAAQCPAGTYCRPVSYGMGICSN